MPANPLIRSVDGDPDSKALALADEAGSPWNSLAFARLQRACGQTTRFLIAERDGEPVGLLALWISGSRRVPMLDSVLTRTVRLPDEPAVPSGDREVAKALAQAAMEEIRRLRAVEAVWRVELPRLLTPGDLALLGFRVETRGVGVLELPRKEEALEGLLSRTARKQVRKARKAGLQVEVAQGVDRLLPLLDRSFARAGLPARDHGYVRLLYGTLSSEVLVVTHAGRDVSALLWSRVGRVGLNVFHGRDDGDVEGASNLLHLELFARCLRAGVEILHTGDAGLPGEADPRVRGITHFKETMGFEVRPAFQGEWTPRPFAAGVRRAALDAWMRVSDSGGAQA